MKDGTKALYMTVPTKEEVEELFQDAESFRKFIDGEDYSYELADVADAEYDEQYEAIVIGVKGEVQEGMVVRPFDRPEGSHLRVSPNGATTRADLDRFFDAVERRTS